MTFRCRRSIILLNPKFLANHFKNWEMQNESYGVYNCSLSNLRSIKEFSSYEDEALENMTIDIQELIFEIDQLNVNRQIFFNLIWVSHFVSSGDWNYLTFCFIILKLPKMMFKWEEKFLDCKRIVFGHGTHHIFNSFDSLAFLALRWEFSRILSTRSVSYKYKNCTTRFDSNHLHRGAPRAFHPSV